MYYTLYKTTNLLNGMIYIGVHQTEDPNDDYLGSGDYITAAIEVYGEQNFKKEILSLHESKEEMYAEEERIVNRKFVKRIDTYNLVTGGDIPPDNTGMKRTETAKANYKNAASRRDKDYANRIAIVRKNNGSYETQRLVAREIGLANKGKKRSEQEIARIKNHTKNSRWFTNGIIDKYIHISKKIPSGFWPGRSKGKIRVRKIKI